MKKNILSFLFKKIKKENEELKEQLKQKEAELNRANELLDAIPFPFIVSGKDHKIEHLNAQALKMLEITDKKADDFVGDTVGAFFYNDPNKEAITDKVLNTGQLFQNVEAELETRRKNPLNVLVHSGPINDVENNIIGAFSFATDITAIKEQERQIIAQSEQLTKVTDSAKEMSEQLAAAMEELSVTAKEIGKSIEENTNTAHTIKDFVDHAKESLKSITATIENHSEKTQAIHKKITEINNETINIFKITEQTNILALNATIESARSGEAGKGFSVIASEVKDLSNTSKEATKIISDLNKDLLSEIESVNKNASDISSNVQKLSDYFLQDSSAEDIENVSLTVSSAVTEMQQSIDELSSLSQRVKDLFE